MLVRVLLATAVLLCPAPLPADFAAGMRAFDRGDDPEALEQWLPLGREGQVEAQFNLGLIYTRDSGVPVDPVEALLWFVASAEQGYARGQYRAAEMYESGSGTKTDLVAAFMWYSLAEDAKYLDARKRRKRVAKQLTPHQLALAQMKARHFRRKSRGEEP